MPGMVDPPGGLLNLHTIEESTGGPLTQGSIPNTTEPLAQFPRRI